MMIRPFRMPGAAALIMLSLSIAPPAFAQVVTSVESPLRAYGAEPGRRAPNPPTAETSYYVTVLPADPDSSTEPEVERVASMPGFQFPAVRLVVSVAPMVFAGGLDTFQERASRALGAVRHLSVYVTVLALDGGGRVLNPTTPGPPPLLTLEIAPSEPAFADANAIGNVSSALATASRELVGHIKPIGGLLQAFQSSFHRPPAATQVPYMTGPNAFGWRWYESFEHTIEGLHYVTALFQAANEAKSLRITVEVVANWRTFRAWGKTYEFVYALNTPIG